MLKLLLQDFWLTESLLIQTLRISPRILTVLQNTVELLAEVFGNHTIQLLIGTSLSGTYYEHMSSLQYVMKAHPLL